MRIFIFPIILRFVKAYSVVLFYLSLFLLVKPLFYTGITATSFLMHYLHLVFPLQLPLFSRVALRLKNNVVQRLFSYKIWVFPFGLLIAASLLLWRFDRLFSKTGATLGLAWSFHAIITYCSLFLVSLYLYQRKIENLPAFILSFITCYFLGIIYELPLLVKLNLVGGIIFRQYLPLTIVVFVGLMLHYKFKLLRFYTFSCLILLFGYYMIYFQIPNDLYWLPRLVPVPLMLSFPLGLRHEK